MPRLTTSTDQLAIADVAAGEAAKAAGMAEADEHTPKAWAAACDAAIEAMAARGIPFQASDLVREGLVEEPDNHHRWGPRFGAAAKRGWIVEYGTGRSKRASSKRSRLATWIGAHAEEAAA